jgi:hypothetical protein
VSLGPQGTTLTAGANLAARVIAGIGDERPSVDKGKNGVGSCGRFKAELVG